MASQDELEKSFNILFGAGLPYPPRREDLPSRILAWKELLADLPGEMLIQAARKIAMNGEQFPGIPTMRESVRKIQSEAQHRPHENVDAQVLHWRRNPLEYWAMIEAEDCAGTDAKKILAEWKASGVETFGDVAEWREMAELSCTA